MRIGQGFDVHPLVAGRKLIIGGVEIPYHKGLEGHSDADVLLHAICDASLAPPASAISAVTIQTPTPRSRAPTAGACCGTWRKSSVRRS